MGPSERGRDPGYEVLPVSVEALFRDLRRSQGRSASTLKVMRRKEEAKMKKKKKIKRMSAVSGTGEKPDSEMLKFTAAAGRNEFPLTEEGSRRRLGASGWLEGVLPIVQRSASRTF